MPTSLSKDINAKIYNKMALNRVLTIKGNLSYRYINRTLLLLAALNRIDTNYLPT
jgi:hypothetical protein